MSEQLWSYEQYMKGKMPPLDNSKIDNADHDELKFIVKDFHKRIRATEGAYYTFDYILRGDGMNNPGLVAQFHQLTKTVKGLVDSKTEDEKRNKTNYEKILHIATIGGLVAFIAILKMGLL